MTARPSPLPVALGNSHEFMPSAERPVRLRSRAMPADTHLAHHCHGWAQLAYCATGVVQVTATQSSDSDSATGLNPHETSYIVPPSRAVWIAPNARHAITVLESAQLRTLYLHTSATPEGWQGCRMMVVSPLLREAIGVLDQAVSTSPDPTREALLMALIADEIRHADLQAIGVPLPHPQQGDKRLRAVCSGVMRNPADRVTLAEWASHAGASERTLARLFQSELGMSYQRWRPQAVLAHALPLLARGAAVGAVAAATGYASESAFSAMFKAAIGQPPSHFQKRKTDEA